MHFHQSYGLVGVHTHTNLLGWVTMTLFGLAYRTGLAMKDGWAVAHFWISAGAVGALPSGMLIAMLDGPSFIVDAGAVLGIASMALFAVNVLRALIADAADRERAARPYGDTSSSAVTD